MNKVEYALSCFKGGFNCAQSVFSTYAKQFGLDKELALKISSPFGGGMARMGKTCGAVTGAFMVIGLKHGKTKDDDEEAKQETYRLVNEFVKRFKFRNNTILCKELINCDLSKPDGLLFARENNIFTEICPKFVQDAIEIIEELLE